MGSGAASRSELSLISSTAGATSKLADSTVAVLAVSSADESTTDSPGLAPQEAMSNTAIRNTENRLIPRFSQNQDVKAPCGGQVGEACDRGVRLEAIENGDADDQWRLFNGHVERSAWSFKFTRTGGVGLFSVFTCRSERYACTGTGPAAFWPGPRRRR